MKNADSTTQKLDFTMNMVISQQNVVIEWDMNMGISWEEIIWV